MYEMRRFLALLFNKPTDDPLVLDTARALRDCSYPLWDLVRSGSGEVTLRWEADRLLILADGTERYQGYVDRVL